MIHSESDSHLDVGQTLPEVIEHWARVDPDRPAWIYLDIDCEEVDRRTFGGLALQMAAVAATLRRRFAPASRLLLLHPPGLDALDALFGCLAAGMVAVPTYPPDPMRLERTLGRLVSIANDVAPVAVLTEALIGTHAELLYEHAPSLRRLEMIRSDLLGGVDALDGPAPSAADAIDPSSVAFLQYSSGSTGDPKGVMVTHANLLANTSMITDRFGVDRDGDVGFSWLPTYHDMGLIGAVMAPLLRGATTYLMSPLDFLRRPSAWVTAMSRYGCTISGGPNFAYDMVLRKTPPELRAGLDLSRWAVAFNGAEPIDATSLDAFADAFAPAGFRRSALLACYGMAEATLLVSGTRRSDEPRTFDVDGTALEAGTVRSAGSGPRRRLVSCGPPAEGVSIHTVDPETGERLADGCVGEILVAGDSVAAGYWGRDSDDAFVIDGTERWLRTGDLGAVLDGELVPTGRCKDLILVRGRNLYPHDLERLVDAADPRIRPGNTAVFSVDPGADERLVVVAEVEADTDPTELVEVAEACRVAVAPEGVDLGGIVLLAPRAVPKTSSGKIQRRAARAAWRTGELDACYEWRAAAPGPAYDQPATVATTADAGAWCSWLRAEVATMTETTVDEISTIVPFADLGLDSLQLVELQERLERHTGRTVTPQILWGHPTIASLTAALAGAGSEPVESDREFNAESPTDAAGGPVPLAITGIGIRFGEVIGPDAVWGELSAGDPTGRLARAAAEGADWSRFDARFFGIAPREAARMDPQHRVLLETVWQAVEDAGIDPTTLAGTSTGVFVGISTADYAAVSSTGGAVCDIHTVTGLSPAVAANRISYLLDLRGPSIAIDTACSSSLVATHLAMRALRGGECERAIVAGINLILRDDITAGLRSAGAMSPTGRCHTFDRAADGYVRGQGCAAVLIEANGAAAASRRCYAQLVGSAVNQDGRTNGLTAPNPLSQEAVLAAALADAGATAADVVAVEAHGTGTPLGDPIEVAALRSVFADSSRRLALTSTKSTVGHLEAAAGIVGLVRTALCAHHGMLLAQPGFDTLNERIDLGDELEVLAADRTWSRGLCGVSSFGFGGTNAHVLLARPEPSPSDPSDGESPGATAIGRVPMSATSDAVLDQRIAQVSALLATAPFGDVAAAVMPVAGWHRHRAVLRADGSTERRDTKQPGDLVVVVFGGQGIGPMTTGLDGRVATGTFEATLRGFDRELGPIGGRPLAEWLDRPDALTTDVVQPLMTAVTIAAFRELQACGIEADVVCGHSIGEIAAVACAGGLDDLEAVALSSARGALMATDMVNGAMANVLAASSDVAELVATTRIAVEIAVRNTATSTVVAGSPTAVDAFEAAVRDRGWRSVRLGVDRAFHSRDVDDCLDRLATLAASPSPRATRLAVASTLDGVVHPGGWVVPADHWTAHARGPVEFDTAMAAVATLATGGTGVRAVELSPRAALGRLRRRHSGERWYAPLDPASTDPWGSLLGDLYLQGRDVQWARLAGTPTHRVAVPPYPFGGARHWIEPAPSLAPEAPVTPDARATPTTIPAVARVGAEPGALDALRVALAGFGVGPGDDVLTLGLTAAAADLVRQAAGALGASLHTGDDPARRPAVTVGHGVSNGRNRVPAILIDDAGQLDARLDLTLARRPVRPRLSLAFFGESARGRERDHYRLLLELARLADGLGYDAIWTPERHFDPFGGAFPAPAVLSAAIARETDRLGIRAGSVVLPLTHPARVAEEWSIVDNLSGGRVGVAFAAGWRERDRVLARSIDRPDIDVEIEQVLALWRGEEIELASPSGHVERIGVRPAPVTAELRAWLTVMKNPESWARAARLGLGVLTNMIGRSPDSLAASVADLHRQRVAAGRGPGDVTVFLHAHVEDDRERARAVARGPLEHYLVTSAALMSRADHLPKLQQRLDAMTPEERDREFAAVAMLSAQRYLDDASLIGDVASAGAVLDRFGRDGVTEVACLLDFGMSPEAMFQTVEQLATLLSTTTRPAPLAAVT